MALQNRVTPLGDLVVDPGRGLIYGSRGRPHHLTGVRFVAIWRELHGEPVGADAVDARLPGERVATGRGVQRHHGSALDDLPDRAFVLWPGPPCLVLGAELQGWTASGDAARLPRRAARLARVITPPSLIGAVRGGWYGYVALVYPSVLAGEA